MDRNMRDRAARNDDERDMDRQNRTQARQQQDGARQNNRQEDEYELPDLIEILKIILTEESKPVPMKSYLRKVDVDKAMYFIEKLEHQMPRAVVESRRILEERDNIISSAERKAKETFDDADNRAQAAMDDAQKSAQAVMAEAEAHATQIIDEAQKQARAMVDQSEVNRRAEEEANKLMASARTKAADTARQATQYADGLLSNLEQFLNSELGDVKKSRENLTGKRENQPAKRQSN